MCVFRHQLVNVVANIRHLCVCWPQLVGVVANMRHLFKSRKIHAVDIASQLLYIFLKLEGMSRNEFVFSQIVHKLASF